VFLNWWLGKEKKKGAKSELENGNVCNGRKRKKEKVKVLVFCTSAKIYIRFKLDESKKTNEPVEGPRGGGAARPRGKMGGGRTVKKKDHAILETKKIKAARKGASFFIKTCCGVTKRAVGHKCRDDACQDKSRQVQVSTQ